MAGADSPAWSWLLRAASWPICYNVLHAADADLRRTPGACAMPWSLGPAHGRIAVTCRDSGLCRWLGVRERACQLVKIVRLDSFPGQRPERANRKAELLEVGTTTWATPTVRLETDSVPFRQHTVFVRRHELGELFARDLQRRRCHRPPFPRYSSRASLTRERARCSSTRWFPSLIPSASHTSPEAQPSRSRSVITTRWLSGSCWTAAAITERASAASNASSGHSRGSDTQKYGRGPWSREKKRDGSTLGSAATASAETSAENGICRPSRSRRADA